MRIKSNILKQHVSARIALLQFDFDLAVLAKAELSYLSLVNCRLTNIFLWAEFSVGVPCKRYKNKGRPWV